MGSGSNGRAACCCAVLLSIGEVERLGLDRALPRASDILQRRPWSQAAAKACGDSVPERAQHLEPLRYPGQEWDASVQSLGDPGELAPRRQAGNSVADRFIPGAAPGSKFVMDEESMPGSLGRRRVKDEIERS